MGWNEPGSGKDPWNRPQSGRKPPDLDELLRRLKARLGGPGPGRPPSLSVFAIGAAIVFVWLLSGLYIIEPAERGVVLQFGRHVTTTGPGPHWHLPFPIQRVEKVNVDKVHQIGDNAVMLTQDENIVNVELAVQYRVSKAEDFLFNVRDPEDTLREATRSAVREVVGTNKVDFVMGEGSVEVADQTQEILQGLLDSYKAGISITALTLLDVQPPEPVQPAFDDVTRAREDEAKKKNEAEAYSNAILPNARGEAARQLAEAAGYRARVVERAKGEAARFTSLAAEYQRAPQVTRKRLYLDAMESVLGNTSKIVVDTKGGNPLLYLPMDQLMRQSGAAPVEPAPRASAAPSPPANPPAADYRGRGR